MIVGLKKTGARYMFSANDGMQKLRGIFDSVYEPELEKFRTWA
ncbi:unnamed protein product [Rhodiola kirilowii]